MKKLFLILASGFAALLPFKRVNAACTTTYYFNDGSTIEGDCEWCPSKSNSNSYYTDFIKCIFSRDDVKVINEYDEDGLHSKYLAFSYDNGILWGYDDVGGYNLFNETTSYIDCSNAVCDLDDDGNFITECYDAKSCSYDVENDIWAIECNSGFYQGYDDNYCSECPNAPIPCHRDDENGGIISECENGYVSDYDGGCQACANTISCSFDRKKEEWIMECSSGHYQNCTDDSSCCNNDCPEGVASCYLEDIDDENSMVIETCNSNYLEKEGSCVDSALGCMGGFCNRIRYTPAEAAAIASDSNTNIVTITFKK